MFKELCATLLLMCTPFITHFDFNYDKDPQREFVEGIAGCTVNYNSFIPPPQRVVVVVSVAQAILESDWGTSRFAKEANNFYGIVQPDPTEPHLKALNSDVRVKLYQRKCESVADYIELLNVSHHFEKYRNERIKQFVTQEIKLGNLIDTLDVYAIDPKYTKKVKEITMMLMTDYPDLFKTPEIALNFGKNL